MALFPAFAAAEQAPVPAAIAAAGQTPIVTLHAEGTQLYECKEKDGKLSWTFREPVAALMQDGRTVGRHFAGPTWEHTDGSAVIAKAAGSAPGATADDVAWLRLDVVDRRGNGMLTPVTVVQRINTHGGALTGTCSERGAFRDVPYSADYVFLGGGDHPLPPGGVPRPPNKF
ncbi:MAG TPA: DUF3455 domain-containing protein [Xanthobacteraceae bacterium]|jgi:hypothetical protein